MNGQVLHLVQREDAETDAGCGDDQAEHQEAPPAHAEHRHGAQVRQNQAGFTAVRLGERQRRQTDDQQGGEKRRQVPDTSQGVGSR